MSELSRTVNSLQESQHEILVVPVLIPCPLVDIEIGRKCFDLRTFVCARSETSCMLRVELRHQVMEFTGVCLCVYVFMDVQNAGRGFQFERAGELRIGLVDRFAKRNARTKAKSFQDVVLDSFKYAPPSPPSVCPSVSLALFLCRSLSQASYLSL
jgi:hypothetical protein